MKTVKCLSMLQTMRGKNYPWKQTYHDFLSNTYIHSTCECTHAIPLPSSVHPLQLQTASWYLPQTLQRICWGSRGRWRSLAPGPSAYCQSVVPSGFYHSLGVRRAGFPSHACSLETDTWKDREIQDRLNFSNCPHLIRVHALAVSLWKWHTK